ncbi:MAG: helicase HerA domain-containing protein [Omnitrophica WOR_2 bacterium]
MDTNGKFYLGRLYDPQQGTVTSQPLLYDPADLTTHAVVVGMTGSGKTGLCLDILEEAALNHIPALMVDPKGDITNALLHFPDLLPQDFQPWVNLDQARREGKSAEQAATETAAFWKSQLAEWGIDAERMAALKDAAHFSIYTPGSDSGIPVSILASLKAPPIPWESNKELLREKISSTVTAILGLVGLQDIDPVRSREHILLSNIFEQAWSQGKDLDLGELILQAQTPPFKKLGVFDIDRFFPEKDRFELAMLLNNILAAPAFQSWIEGQPLDIPGLLYGEDGRPRHSVFYIAHLSDPERMFFVTLLYSAVEAWMRTQTGATSLRALVYFDEISGYLPPVGNPPSKQPVLRMLKQARAFGVGLVLVTQNPVDIDYKALSNAGTWFIGKLQTDQDKQRLLDGLEGASGGNFDRPQYNRLISSLGKRVFLLHDVHETGPVLFQTRWAMNFLAGPLTRPQIPLLNQLSGAASVPGAPPVLQKTPEASQPDPGLKTAPLPVMDAPASTTGTDTVPVSRLEERLQGSTTRPAVPEGVKEYILPNTLTFTQAFEAAGKPFPQEAYNLGLVYRPVLLGQVNIRFLNRKYNLDYDLKRAVIVPEPGRSGVLRWENYLVVPIDARQLQAVPDPQAHYATLEQPFSDVKAMTALQKDFLDWAYRTGQVSVHTHEALGLYAGPDTSEAEFRAQCSTVARQGRDEELRKVSEAYDKKIEALQLKLAKEERELDQDRTELSQRRMEELGTGVENVLGLFGGRKSSRRLSSSLTKHRLTGQAKADVDESVKMIQEYQQEIAGLQSQKEQALHEAAERWGMLASQIGSLNIAAQKKDILLEFFGAGWLPYYQVRMNAQIVELPGY